MIRVIISMRFRKIISCIALSGLLSTAADAQIMEVGINAGAAGYMGDLNPKNPLVFSGVSFGAFVKGNLDPYWAVGLHYNYGKVKGNDLNSSNADFRNRGVNFSTPLNELSLQVDFNFLDYFSGGGTKNFTPYIFGGLGGVLFNPKSKYDGDTYELRYYKTEGVKYKNYALSVPYGVGVKYRISDRLGLLAQLGYRTTMTDYLDDVSGYYPVVPGRGKNGFNLSDPSSSAVIYPENYPKAGIQRGDFNKRDTYLFLHIGLSYTFTSDKCYAF